MEERSDDGPFPAARLKAAIVFNLKKGVPGATADMEAEYDNLDTVLAIQKALEKGGAETTLAEADDTLPQRLLADRPDIVFNIAEGFRGRGREAQIPALLNMLGIPFTGSDETALGIALDKALCKRLLSTFGVRTPRFAVIANEADIAAAAESLRFPVIVKPNAEGSSKGVSDVCIASDGAELRRVAAEDLRLYGEPMLAEEYMDGREFTVGILGNGAETRVFPPMEIRFRSNTQGPYRVYSFGVKKDYKKYVEYRCPAELTPEQAREMTDMARTAYDALGCCDFTRVDFRMNREGTIHFIEMNPLPGLAPGYSDYPMLAEFCGMGYDELVLAVLRAGAKRCGLPEGGGAR